MLSLRFDGDTIMPVRGDGGVAFGPLSYILSKSFALNTAKTYLSTISHVEDLCEFFEIDDYEDRLAFGPGLTNDELLDINLGLQFRAEDMKRLLKAKHAGASVDLLFKEWNSGRQVSAGVIARNKIVARQYFECLMANGGKCLRHYVCPPSLLDARRDAFRAIAEIIEPPKVDRKQQGTKAALDDLITLERFMENYDPKLIWKSDEVALRNHVIFDLQFWCGLRRGEVLSLKLEDMKTKSEFISVIDRRDEDDDPRGAYAPAIKTYERPVWVPKFIWTKVAKWRAVKLDIEEELYDIGQKESQNKYLFVSLDRRQKSFGRPLSLGAVSQAFDQIKLAANMDIGGGSHLLRHLSAMRFVRMRTDAHLDRESIIQDLRTQFGWAPESQMPFYYTSREVTRQNNEMMKAHDAEHIQRMQERQLADDLEYFMNREH